MEQYQDSTLAPEVRAADLLRRMTLREKVGQLTQRLYGFACYRRVGDQIELTAEFQEEVARYGGLGTLYGLHRADPWSGRDYESGLTDLLAVRARNQVQRYVLEHSRLGIPVLLSSESPHGHQALDGYLLPVNLACGCSFAPELLEEAAAVCGRQLQAMGIDLALVSALDVLRDPRWGRSEECFSEDPYLASQMAAAVVRGYQSQGVDVVAKHLCAQGETTGGVNASAARIGPRELREIHLPPVKACVEAGAAAFMAAYNEIDGIYCHANHWLLTELLRGEYGFTGFVMSDGVAIDQLDAVTGDRTASGALALNAGVDMGLWDTGFQQLEEAVDRGLVEERRIDEAVERILTVKFRRGLFERPYIPETAAYRQFTPQTYPQAERLAERSLVLLKNADGLLPLSAAAPRRLGLVGPNADALRHRTAAAGPGGTQRRRPLSPAGGLYAPGAARGRRHRQAGPGAAAGGPRRGAAGISPRLPNVCPGPGHAGSGPGGAGGLRRGDRSGGWQFQPVCRRGRVRRQRRAEAPGRDHHGLRGKRGRLLPAAAWRATGAAAGAEGRGQAGGDGADRWTSL